MSKRIGVTIATLLASGAGLAGPASAGSSLVQRPACPFACPAVYQPVTCTFSDGRVLTFGNRCEAGLFACRQGVTIVSCVEGV